MQAAPASVPADSGSLGRYPAATLLADAARTAAGLAATVGPLALVDAHPVVALGLGAMAAVFTFFGVRTVMRSLSRVHLDDDRLSVDGPWRRHLDWCQLRRLTLTYWSTRRDRRGGWMQLELRAAGVRIGLESTLVGFDLILARAARAARENRLSLDDATRENLLEHGHHVPSVKS